MMMLFYLFKEMIKLYILLMTGVAKVTAISWCTRLINWKWCFLLLSCKKCSDSSMSLLVLLSSIIIFFWGPSPYECLPPPLTGLSRASYSAKSFVPLNGGETLWLLRSWWYLKGGRVIIILQVVDKNCWGDDLSSPLSFRSAGDTG